MKSTIVLCACVAALLGSTAYAGPLQIFRRDPEHPPGWRVPFTQPCAPGFTQYRVQGSPADTQEGGIYTYNCDVYVTCPPPPNASLLGGLKNPEAERGGGPMTASDPHGRNGERFSYTCSYIVPPH